MASLTGRWQGLTLVAFRALNKDQVGLIRALGMGRAGQGSSRTSIGSANFFSSFSPSVCRLSPLPCAQVFLRLDFKRGVNQCTQVARLDGRLWKIARLMPAFL